MKCGACEHENSEPEYFRDPFRKNDNAFRSIGHTCRVRVVSTVGYYNMDVNEVTELFACPKCKTVRIKD
jgi:hypothetical protein